MSYIEELFDLREKVAVVTGGTGSLGATLTRGLALAGVKVAVLGRNVERAGRLVAELEEQGLSAMALKADVLVKDELLAARTRLIEQWGGVDILVNAAGGNLPEATLAPDQSIFDLPQAAFSQVVNLNWIGTVLPCQIFGEVMALQRAGSIINISSMAASRALTRVAGYSAAKAAVENFTRWLSVELAQSYGDGLRVNALAPGFFIGEQNRRLLLQDDGSPTERGRRIIEQTPMRRFGEPDELLGALLWLASGAARFVTGVVVAVDGGFSAFSGV